MPRSMRMNPSKITARTINASVASSPAFGQMRAFQLSVAIVLAELTPTRRTKMTKLLRFHRPGLGCCARWSLHRSNKMIVWVIETAKYRDFFNLQLELHLDQKKKTKELKPVFNRPPNRSRQRRQTWARRICQTSCKRYT